MKGYIMRNYNRYDIYDMYNKDINPDLRGRLSNEVLLKLRRFMQIGEYTQISSLLNQRDNTGFKLYLNREDKYNKEPRYTQLIKELREVMKYYNQYGQDIYEIFVSEINKSNYPAEIKEKLLAEIKNDLFPQQTKKEPSKEEEEISEFLSSLGIRRDLFTTLYKKNLFTSTECVDYDKAVEKLLSIPLDMKKKIMKTYNYDLFLSELYSPLGSPEKEKEVKELYLYALENNIILEKSIIKGDLMPLGELRNDLDIQLAIVNNIPNLPIKKLNLLPQAKIEYIKKRPEEIITNITKFNYNQDKKLTIYDLNKEELEIYKKSIEEYFLNKVRNNPAFIKEIKNPSKIVQETALAVFKEQYIR